MNEYQEAFIELLKDCVAYDMIIMWLILIDMNYKEIADTMGTNESNIKMRMLKIKAKGRKVKRRIMKYYKNKIQGE